MTSLSGSIAIGTGIATGLVQGRVASGSELGAAGVLAMRAISNVVATFPAYWVNQTSNWCMLASTQSLLAKTLPNSSRETRLLAMKVVQAVSSILFFTATVLVAQHLFFLTSSIALKGVVLGVYSAFTSIFFTPPRVGSSIPGNSLYAAFIPKDRHVDLFFPLKEHDPKSVEAMQERESARNTYYNFFTAGNLSSIALTLCTANPILAYSISHTAATVLHIAYVRFFDSQRPAAIPAMV